MPYDKRFDRIFSALVSSDVSALRLPIFVVPAENTSAKTIIREVADALNGEVYENGYVCVAEVNGVFCNVLSLLPTEFIILDGEHDFVALRATIKTADIEEIRLEVSGSYGKAEYEWVGRSPGRVRLSSKAEAILKEDASAAASVLLTYVSTVLRAYVLGGRNPTSDRGQIQTPPNQVSPCVPAVLHDCAATWYPSGAEATPRRHPRQPTPTRTARALENLPQRKARVGKELRCRRSGARVCEARLHRNHLGVNTMSQPYSILVDEMPHMKAALSTLVTLSTVDSASRPAVQRALQAVDEAIRIQATEIALGRRLHLEGAGEDTLRAELAA